MDRLRIAKELEEFSPIIGWHDWGGHWCFCLDVTGTSRWFGGEAALLDQLRVWCDERRCAACAAIAESLGAAWAVAHFSESDVASTFAAYVVPTERTVDALAALPIEALRLTDETMGLLVELGITTIEPLHFMPREALAERFEPELLTRLDQANAVIGELFTPYRPKLKHEVEQSWEFGVTSAEVLAEVWQRCLPKLLMPLASRSRGIARFVAELSGETGSLCRLVIGLMRPSLDRQHLLGLLRLRLESVRLREPIISTRLCVLEDAPLAIQQQVLFAELSPPTESPAWTSLVERLSGRLGSERVVAIRPHSDHDPARAWKAEPWIAKPSRDRKPPYKSTTKLPPRPTQLLTKPRSIQVLALAPQGHPQRFDDRGKESRVVRSWGPERIETGWWRGPSLRRDYFRVETESGSHAWLFRDLRTRRWFLHGWFD
jgi:protein ImuB